VSRDDPIDVLRRGYEAFRQEGIEGVIPFLDPEIEWRNPRDSPIAGVFRGHAGVREWFAAVTSAFDELRFEPDEFRALDEGRVLVFLRFSFRGAGSDITLEVPFAHVWSIRNGLATHLQMYSDPSDAIADVTKASKTDPTGDG
jgi:ketosteroid isomerase-like protein